MRHGNINLVDLDFEYKLWKNRLALFIREIEILRLRNEELISQPGSDLLNSVELMVLDEHEDQLKKVLKRIQTQEEELQFYNKDFPITISHEYFRQHEVLRRKMKDISKVHFEKVNDLVNELGI